MRRKYETVNEHGQSEQIMASSSDEAKRFCKRWRMTYLGRRGGFDNRRKKA